MLVGERAVAGPGQWCHGGAESTARTGDRDITDEGTAGWDVMKNTGGPGRISTQFAILIKHDTIRSSCLPVNCPGQDESFVAVQVELLHFSQLGNFLHELHVHLKNMDI
jgi:hypothetical protein